MTQRKDDNMATSTEGVAYQANFKTPGGSLLNIYATDGGEFAELLVGFEEFVAPIIAIESALRGASNVAAVVAVAPAAQQPPTVAPVATPPAPVGDAPLCEHGQPMKKVGPGISKATGKPYGAFWACSQPRGMQCNAKVSG
jgi:hypothetical protein